MFGGKNENPHSYPTKRLGEIYKYQYGKGNKIPESKGEYPTYGSNGQVGFHTEYNSEDSPVIGHIGTAGTVVWAPGKHFVTYNGVICKKIDEQIDDKYGFFQLKNQEFEKVALKGTSQPFISYEDLETPIIPVPPMEKQLQFRNILEQSDKSKYISSKVRRSLCLTKIQ